MVGVLTHHAFEPASSNNRPYPRGTQRYPLYAPTTTYIAGTLYDAREMNGPEFSHRELRLHISISRDRHAFTIVYQLLAFRYASAAVRLPLRPRDHKTHLQHACQMHSSCSTCSTPNYFALCACSSCCFFNGKIYAERLMLWSRPAVSSAAVHVVRIR